MITNRSIKLLVPVLGFLSCLWFSLSAYPQTPAPSLCSLPDDVLIEAVGSTSVYLVRGGKKYGVPSMKWMFKNGYKAEDVHFLSAPEVEAIPTDSDLTESSIPGTPAALEGKLILAQNKVYVVKQGVRHWVLDGRWFSDNGYAGQSAMPVTESELKALPLGSDYPYTSLLSKIWIFVLTLVLFAFFFFSKHVEYRDRLGPLFHWFSEDKGWTTWHSRMLLFALFAAVIIARQPNLLLHPRFWAEEGTVWFQYGSSHSFIETILYVYPLSSYFNLTANVGAVLSSMTAAIFGIEYAPAATTVLALVIQVLAIALILFGRSHLLDTLWKAAAACLIVIFATEQYEIWLNTINSMSFLGLISLLLLFEKTWTWPGRLRWVSRGMLVVCGLSSPYTVAMLPLFLVSAAREKMREQKIQCLILIVCVLVQTGVVVSTRMSGHETFRGTAVRLDTSMVNIFGGHIARPALGSTSRENLIGQLGLKEAWNVASSFPPRPTATSLPLAGWLCFILIAAILWQLKGSTVYGVTNRVLAAFLLLSIFTCATSLHSVPLGRYAFLPGSLFLFLLLMNIDSCKTRLAGYLCMLILSYGLANGIDRYGGAQQEGPSWSGEIQIWRTNHTYPLRVWPAGWNEGIRYSEPPTH